MSVHTEKHTEQEFDSQFSTQELTINMGPQHPSTHGVLRVEIVTDGEIIKGAYPDIGYLHRCFEKHAESREYLQVVPFTDRMDYVASMNMELGLCLAIERLIESEVPERAQAIRVIVCELNRIASHLLAIGTYGLDMGGFTPFLYAFRDREHILSIFEELCGARLLYNYIRPGGVSRDMSRGLQDKVKDFCAYFKPQLEEINELLSFNSIFVQRTANIGVVSPELAISYGFSGPNLRGSGIDWDLRRDKPYSGYEKYEFNVCVGTGEKGTVGDCWNRYYVRIKEMFESLKIIEQAVKALPEGESMGKVPKAVKPVGEIYVETECPRGALGYYMVSDGSKKPLRLKAKSPGFIAVSSMDEVCSGMMLADVVAYIGSIDIVLGEVDR
ncbi:MAG: NADH-quinone oxidoreductase subunit D [Bdellovibrionales bacterium]|nr:NADH-quinone oxidoreductase subunit D [Bdellovibrionales bacterium]